MSINFSVSLSLLPHLTCRKTNIFSTQCRHHHPNHLLAKRDLISCRKRPHSVKRDLIIWCQGSWRAWRTQASKAATMSQHARGFLFRVWGLGGRAWSLGFRYLNPKTWCCFALECGEKKSGKNNFFFLRPGVAFVALKGGLRLDLTHAGGRRGAHCFFLFRF